MTSNSFFAFLSVLHLDFVVVFQHPHKLARQITVLRTCFQSLIIDIVRVLDAYINTRRDCQADWHRQIQRSRQTTGRQAGRQAGTQAAD
jgi:t-SNARE complex subunit (syntaxin)